MPFPIYDLQSCMKTSAEKTEQLAKKIQDLLQRNVTPCKYSHGQAFRLQQGFLLSSTQQMVDRLVVQTQDTIKTLAAESCDANNDINYATGLILIETLKYSRMSFCSYCQDYTKCFKDAMRIIQSS